MKDRFYLKALPPAIQRGEFAVVGLFEEDELLSRYSAITLAGRYLLKRTSKGKDINFGVVGWASMKGHFKYLSGLLIENAEKDRDKLRNGSDK